MFTDTPLYKGYERQFQTKMPVQCLPIYVETLENSGLYKIFVKQSIKLLITRLMSSKRTSNITIVLLQVNVCVSNVN